MREEKRWEGRAARGGKAMRRNATQLRNQNKAGGRQSVPLSSAGSDPPKHSPCLGYKGKENMPTQGSFSRPLQKNKNGSFCVRTRFPFACAPIPHIGSFTMLLPPTENRVALDRNTRSKQSMVGNRQGATIMCLDGLSFVEGQLGPGYCKRPTVGDLQTLQSSHITTTSPHTGNNVST